MFYYQLFYNIYKFLENTEADYFRRDQSTRAAEVVAVISLMELLNIMSIFPDVIVGKNLIAPLTVLLTFNFFVFVFRKRYAKILVKLNKNYSTDSWVLITILYFVVTIAFFIISR